MRRLRPSSFLHTSLQAPSLPSHAASLAAKGGAAEGSVADHVLVRRQGENEHRQPIDEAPGEKRMITKKMFISLLLYLSSGINFLSRFEVEV